MSIADINASFADREGAIAALLTLIAEIFDFVAAARVSIADDFDHFRSVSLRLQGCLTPLQSRAPQLQICACQF
ncbi:MAG: hypothetical protein NTV80_19505 [Verrucomicrobia bacterium]|nr:hypothetical protein [Verrucomicrobiota bacterium]